MMPEILSQSQIDELLSELQKGEDITEPGQKKNTRKIKDYDFKSPKRLSKDQLKLIAGIYENFARHMASYFSGILRAYCEITVHSIEEQPYFEYNNALPDAILIGVMEAKPIEGSVLVDISNAITFFLIERLLGGDGDGVSPEREFTEIETDLMEGVFHRIAAYMKESWSHFYEVDASLKEIETNSRLIQSMAMDEVVAIIVLDVTIRDVKGTITFCIPCINIESMLEHIGRVQYSPKRRQDGAQDEALKETLTEKIRSSAVEMRGIFGSAALTLHDVANLQVGDVIRLDQRIDSSIALKIHDRTWFYGIPGIKKNKKVIKVSKIQ